MDTLHRHQKFFFLSATIISGLLTALLRPLTPPGADDLLFMIPAKGHEPGFGLIKKMIEELPWVWETQSGRLGNFVSMPFLYLMPKWIFGLITGLILSILILISCRLAKTRSGSIASWMLYATFIFAYPWYDYLTLVTYAINYIWAAAAVAAAMLFFLNVRNASGAACICGCLLSFIAGWMHEGFGAPFTAGLTLCIILKFIHHNLDRREIAAWICAGIGTCMTFMSPVFWLRSQRETNFLLKFTYKEFFMQLGPALIFVIALIILTVMLILKHRQRKPMRYSIRAILFIGCAIASTTVFLKYYTGPRTGAPVILYSAIGCGYLVRSLSGRIYNRSLQWGIGVIIASFSIIHLVYADASQVKCLQEYKQVTQLYQDSPDGTFYYDLSYPKADLSLFKTSVRQFHEKTPKAFMRQYFSPEKDMVILPSEMKGFSPQKSRASQSAGNAMIYNGWIVLPGNADINSSSRLHIFTATGENLPSRFRIDRFNVAGYGEFILVTPHIKVLDPSIEIVDVDLSDDTR